MFFQSWLWPEPVYWFDERIDTNGVACGAGDEHTRSTSGFNCTKKIEWVKMISVFGLPLPALYRHLHASLQNKQSAIRHKNSACVTTAFHLLITSCQPPAAVLQKMADQFRTSTSDKQMKMTLQQLLTFFTSSEMEFRAVWWKHYFIRIQWTIRHRL